MNLRLARADLRIQHIVGFNLQKKVGNPYDLLYNTLCCVDPLVIIELV